MVLKPADLDPQFSKQAIFEFSMVGLQYDSTRYFLFENSVDPYQPASCGLNFFVIQDFS